VLLVSGWVIFAIAGNKGERENGLDSAIRAADEAFQAGTSRESYDELKAAIDKAKSKEDKLRLYTNLAAAAASAGKLADAIDFLQKKHSLAPETAKEDAYLLGTYYERMGNAPNAIAQYKKALEYCRSLPEDAATNARIDNLEARIASLGG
jgi:tetratricopeptide (TPR) repeat protein